MRQDKLERLLLWKYSSQDEKKFIELLLLLLLLTRVFSLKVKGKMYDVCVRTAMLYSSKSLNLNAKDLSKLERNEVSKIQWVCDVNIHEWNDTNMQFSQTEHFIFLSSYPSTHLNFRFHTDALPTTLFLSPPS